MPQIQLPGRFTDWWFSKTPLLLAVVYASVLLNGEMPQAATLGWFLLSYAGMAAYGYLLNDWFDRVPDAAAGKKNSLARTTGFAFVLYALVAACAGLLPWWITLPASGLSRCLIVAELVLLSIYAMPPLRLKERGWIAVFADCGYGFLLPFLLTANLFVHAALSSLSIAAFCAWLTVAGVRNILMHQVVDYAHDTASGTATIATRIGLGRTRRLIHFRLFFAELICFFVLCFTLPQFFAWLPAFYVLYVVYAYRRELMVLKREGNVRKSGYSFICNILLNEFYEKWLPYLLIIPLCFRDYSFLLLLILHSLLFYPHARSFYNEAVMLSWKAEQRLRRFYHVQMKRTYYAAYKFAKVSAYRFLYAPARNLLRLRPRQ